LRQINVARASRGDNRSAGVAASGGAPRVSDVASMIPAPPDRSRLRLARLAREYRTIRVMVDMHCRAHHAAAAGGCAQCAELVDYAGRRIDRCPFRERKPTCAKCTVHCYSEERREQMKSVMRYAGPRMTWRHPLLALAHVVDGFRKAPHLPKPRPRAR
jgi:hypothetical protein